MDSLRFAAQAARLYAERRATDPLWTWEPLPHQRRLIHSEKAEAWLLGANRSGKSDPLAAWAASLFRFGHPDPRPSYAAGGRIELRDRAVSLWMVSLTFDMSRDIMQPKIFDNGYVPAGQPHPPFIPKHEIAHWTATSQILKGKTGSLLGFKTADQGRERMQGTGKDGIGFDEAPPKPIYDEAVIRVEAGRKLWIRGAATLLPPDGQTGGVAWLYSEKIQPWLQGDTTKTADLELIRASIYDNPFVLPGELERLEAIYPAGSIDRRIRLAGEWLPGLTGQRAYSAFHRGIHVNPKLSRDSVEFRHPLFLTVDVNVSPLGASVWQQIGRVYRKLDEFMFETGSIRDLGQEFRRRFPVHGAALEIYGDATSHARKAQTARSDYELLLDELQGLPYPVNLCIPDKNPPIRDRVNAVNWMLKGPGGEVRAHLAPHCTESIDDYEQVLLDKDGSIKKSRNPQDPYYRRTSWTDGDGYLFAFREPVIAGGLRLPERSRPLPRPGYRFG